MKLPSGFTIIMIAVSSMCSLALGLLLYSEILKLEDFLNYITYFLMAGIVTPIGILIVKQIVKHEKKETDQSTQTTDILNQNRSKYHKHVQTLFRPIASGGVNRYFSNLRKIEDTKKLLLQHFSTTELVHQEYNSLYVWYRTIVTLYNDLEKDRKKFPRLIDKLGWAISDMGFTRPCSENWMQITDLRSAIGVKIPSLMDVARDLSILDETNIPYSLEFDFPIIFDSNTNEWRIGTENNRFAGSKSKEKIEELQNYLKTEGEKINLMTRDYHSHYKTLKEIGEYGFNQQFNEIYQLIVHGEPKVGACDSCIEWFSGEEQKKLRQILVNMHKKPEFLEESQWTNKKFKEDS